MATFAIAAATRKAQATANGSTTNFAFSFSINVEADIAVYVNTTLKTISTHYTVSITSSTGAGSITFTSGNTPTNGQIVTLMSKTALARASVYTSGGTINATSLETDFDTNMMLFQQQDERLDRVIMAPVDDATSINMTLPNKDARKGGVLGFNATSGNPEATSQVTDAAVNVSTVSVGGSATATVAVSGGTATFALGIPTGATGATGPAGSGDMSDLTDDTSPQLGGNLDTNSHNILIDDAHFIADESGNEQIVFQTTGSAVNHLEVTNNAAGSNPILGAAGGDTNIGIALAPKGTGEVVVAAGNLNYGGTAVTSTGAEINLIAGGTARGTTAVADGDGMLVNDAGTMRMTTVQTVKTYMTAGVGGGLAFLASSGAISDGTASVTFNQFDASKYDLYKFFIFSVVPVTDNVVFRAQLSADGTNFDTTNGNYHTGYTDDTALIIAAEVGGESGELLGVSVESTIYDIDSTAKHTVMRSGGVHQYSGAANYSNTVATVAHYQASTAAHTAIKFLFSSGNIESGEITMFGIVNS